MRPLARLTIDPGDFPFLDQVGGHDDGELIAADELGDIVMSKVTNARPVPGGLVVSLAWDEQVAGIWDEYLASAKRFNPDVERSLDLESNAQATMLVMGPKGFLQAYASSLHDRGIDLEP